MNLYDFWPIKVLITAAHSLVTQLSDALQPLVGASSAALAIVLLTLAVRTLLIPVGRSQVKAGITQQRLGPRIAELRERHRHQPEVLQRKLAEFYAAEKTSPVAGCLPLLAQTPVLVAVYGLFILPTINGHPNHLLAHTFLGIGLDARFVGQLGAGSVTWPMAAVFAGIMIVIAVVAQASRRYLVAAQPPVQAAPQPGVPDLSGLVRMMSFLPFVTAVVAAFVPLAAALYLMITTSWTLVERLVLTRILGTGTS